MDSKTLHCIIGVTMVGNVCGIILLYWTVHSTATTETCRGDHRLKHKVFPKIVNIGKDFEGVTTLTKKLLP